jgi:predicted kinase
MSEVLFLRGLPASGKSQFANELVQRDGNWVRANKDDLRSQLHAGKWSQGRERIVKQVRDAIIDHALSIGKNVVVDDTNFAPAHEQRCREIAKKHNATFAIKDFTHVPLEECLRRDAERAKPVGRDVILRMWHQYLKPTPVAHDPRLPHAFICDLDGTLAVVGKRSFYDASKCDETDAVNFPMFQVVRGLVRVEYEAIYVSGRQEKDREPTLRWLSANAPSGHLFMRATGDNRRDSVVKREIFETHIRGKFNVLCAFDDRQSVIIECWRALGVPVFDVGPGFDF